MPSNAYTQFNEQIGFVDQLIAIHGKLQTGQGRRHEQDAIHRAGVVMTVAAWESYIEKVLMEAFAAVVANAAGGPNWARHILTLKSTEVKETASDFHTPNGENVQRMFKRTLEFDPIPSWTWNAPNRNWNPEEMKTRLNAWVKIRHSVAHGGDLPDNIQWIKHPATQIPRLNLTLLRECRRFFDHVVVQTDDAIRLQLQNHHGVPSPW